MNIFEIIFLFFAFQSIVLAALFILRKRGDRIANRILGIYLCLFSFNIIYNVLYWSKYLFTDNYIHLYGISTLVIVSYPSVIYLYVRRVIKNEKSKFSDLIHAIPLVLFIGLYSRFFILNASLKLELYKTEDIGVLGDYIFLLKYRVLIIISIMIFYVLLTYLSFKNTTGLGLNKKRWLGWLIGSFASYVFLMIIYYTLNYLQLITNENDYIIMSAIIFSICLVSYFGFMQPEVFDGLSIDKILPFIKYRTTGLSQNLSEEYKQKLLHFMNSEKPYLDNELRLSDLSKRLNLSRHHMSQIINENFDASFFYFINTYRISEAKELIISKRKLNVSEVIYSCGFNNRASFYKAFKEHTGYTPSAYKSRSKNKQTIRKVL